MIFSPVFWLLYFFWKEKDGIGGKFSITEFLSLALVPVYVAWALSFGLLFIFVAWQWLGKASNSTDQWALIFSVSPTDKWSTELDESNKKVNNPEKKIKTASGTTVVKLMNAFSVEMWWSLVNSWNDVNKIGQVLTWFKGSLWTLIMQLFGLAVLWISVMAALASNKITEQVVKPIAEFGTKVWQLAMKAPQYTPIFGGQSVASMTRVGQLWVQHYENKPQENAQQFVKDKWLFGASESAKLSAAITANTAQMWSKADDAKAIKAMIGSVTDPNVLVNSPEFIEKLAEAMKRAGVSGHDKLRVWDTHALVQGIQNYEADMENKGYWNMFDHKANQENIADMASLGKIMKKWWSESKAKNEWEAWFIDWEQLVDIRNKEATKVKLNDKWWKSKDILYTAQTLWNTGINFIKTKQSDDEKWEIHLMMDINGTWHWMKFEKMSAKAFDNSVTSLNDITNKLEPNDKNQLVKILKNMSPDVQVEFLKELFPSAKDNIDITKDDFKEFVK